MGYKLKPRKILSIKTYPGISKIPQIHWFQVLYIGGRGQATQQTNRSQRTVGSGLGLGMLLWLIKGETPHIHLNTVDFSSLWTLKLYHSMHPKSEVERQNKQKFGGALTLYPICPCHKSITHLLKSVILCCVDSLLVSCDLCLGSTCLVPNKPAYLESSHTSW